MQKSNAIMNGNLCYEKRSKFGSFSLEITAERTHQNSQYIKQVGKYMRGRKTFKIQIRIAWKKMILEIRCLLFFRGWGCETVMHQKQWSQSD